MAKSYIEIIESYMSSVIYELGKKEKIPLSMTLESSEYSESEIDMEDQVKMGYLRNKYNSLSKK
ncbi:MAG: hypothetical protein P8Y97_14730 [Candidatus Lokiarchaeota archaeon]